MTGIKPEADPDLPGSPTSPATSDAPTKEPDSSGDHAKGRPHSDRHAAETVAGRLDQQRPSETKAK